MMKKELKLEELELVNGGFLDGLYTAVKACCKDFANKMYQPGGGAELIKNTINPLVKVFVYQGTGYKDPDDVGFHY